MRKVAALAGVTLLGCNSVTNAAPTQEAGSSRDAAVSDAGPTAQTLACRNLFANSLGADAHDDARASRVSFRGELLPIFSTHCDFGGCHGGRETTGQLRLGDACDFDPQRSACVVDASSLTADVAEIVQANLLSPSNAAPHLRRAEPGQPAQSFMLMKLSGCQNAFPERTGCASCGSLMPPDGPLLKYDPDVFATIARWISQGAELD
jgi:hypothetical protein